MLKPPTPKELLCAAKKLLYLNVGKMEQQGEGVSIFKNQQEVAKIILRNNKVGKSNTLMAQSTTLCLVLPCYFALSG